VTCQEGEPFHQWCAYRACEVDSVSSEARCSEVRCLPNCFMRDCGDDGCGGSCGECEAGEECRTEVGVCLPATSCGPYADGPACVGQALVSCAGGALVAEGCLPQGKICAPGPCDEPPACRPVVPGTPCGNVPAWNACENGHVFRCENGVLKVSHCVLDGYKGCIRVDIDTMDCDPNPY
jgi:hypothetical protein